MLISSALCQYNLLLTWYKAAVNFLALTQAIIKRELKQIKRFVLQSFNHQIPSNSLCTNDFSHFFDSVCLIRFELCPILGNSNHESLSLLAE